MGQYDHDEGYYEDDGDFLEEEPQRLRQRVLAVFGTSYGISFLVHGALLLILMTIVIAAPVVEEIQSIVVKQHEAKSIDYSRSP